MDEVPVVVVVVVLLSSVVGDGDVDDADIFSLVVEEIVVDGVFVLCISVCSGVGGSVAVAADVVVVDDTKAEASVVLVYSLLCSAEGDEVSCVSDCDCVAVVVAVVLVTLVTRRGLGIVVDATGGKGAAACVVRATMIPKSEVLQDFTFPKLPEVIELKPSPSA